SASSAMPSANDHAHLRRGPAAGRRSGVHTGPVTAPANPAINFHAAVAPIGSTSEKPSAKHSAPWAGLLGARAVTASFLAVEHALSGSAVPARLVVWRRL